MNYIRQILFELRDRPLITWITIAGTALSLFLLMAVYMTDSIHTIEMPPESHRSRILYAPSLHIMQHKDGSGYSGSMSLEMAKTLFGGIDGIEKETYVAGWMLDRLVSLDGVENHSYKEKRVDADFWKVFDFQFVTGSPFTTSEVEAGVKEVILSESVAHEVGKGSDLTGREILLDYIPYRVKGIVRDPHPLLTNSWSEVYTAWKDTAVNAWCPQSGNTQVYLEMRPGVDPASVKREARRRHELFNKQHKADEIELIYHTGPFTMKEQAATTLWSNIDPDFESGKYHKYFLYVILLLLPAINLSGMTRSRLRRRISEIGVRRAYGASRFRIMSQLIMENFLLTLAGGVLGLAISIGFTIGFSHLFVDYINSWSVTTVQANATPLFSMLFNWKIFCMALLFCFFLNILSTGIPAWKASRVNPAEAISGKNS